MATGGERYTEGGEVSGRELEVILCQPCLQQDKQSTAEKFCSTCNEFQCMDCLKVHYTHAYMKDHKIVNSNEGEEKQISIDMKGLDRCDLHQKEVEFFCEDDNQLCCSRCAFADHRKCNNVVDIQQAAGMSTSTSPNVKVKLQDVRQKAEIIIKNVVYSKEKLGKDVEEIPVKIRRMRDEVIKMFDELEISVVKRAEILMTDKLEKLTKKQSRNEKYLASVQSCLDTVDNVYQSGTLVQQFMIEQTMQKEVHVLETKVDAESQGLETVTISFDFDETLKLPPLPTIDYVPGQLNIKSCLSEPVGTISPDITKMKLTPIISIDLKQGEDDKREPLYLGIDFLPDGRLVAVDNKNKKYLVYDENLKKVGSYQLSYSPQSVVAVSEQEVAITGCNKYQLDILRVDKSNDISLDRTYKVTTKYYSICLKDSKHFVVGTVDHSTPVRILSSTGEEKDFNINFPNKTCAIGKSACTYIRNSEKVVLTDRLEHTVYIYDIKTNTRVVVKDDQIKEPFGVAVGPSDTILVCSKNTNSIVQISQTGQILSSNKIDMTYPSKICVSSDNSYIVITNNCSGEKKLQKLKISF